MTSKQKLHLIKARKQRHVTQENKSATHLNALRFVFSVIVEGSSFAQASRLMAWNDILPPSKATFYRVQKHVNTVIEEMAHASCQRYSFKMKPGAIIAYDGSWSHKRNAAHCVTDFVDLASNKIIYFSFQEKSFNKFDGNFEGASNAMETASVYEFVHKFKNNKKIIGYCHDRDAKTRAVFRREGWNIREYIDKNHALKTFDRIYIKKNKECDSMLTPLYGKLRRWLRLIIYFDESIDKKISCWKNSYSHYCGDHSNCKHSAEKEVYEWEFRHEDIARQKLFELIKESIPILESTAYNVSTQLCESMHAIKTRFANKNIAWQSSWKARVCAAILQINDPQTWKFELYHKLNLPPISKECIDFIKRTEEEKMHERMKYRQPEIRKKRNAQKAKKRHDSEHNKGASLYKGMPKFEKSAGRRKETRGRKKMNKKEFIMDIDDDDDSPYEYESCDDDEELEIEESVPEDDEHFDATDPMFIDANTLISDEDDDEEQEDEDEGEGDD